MSRPTRGALYIVWGDYNKEALDRSVASFQYHHPDLPIHLETLADGSTLLDKANMYLNTSRGSRTSLEGI